MKIDYNGSEASKAALSEAVLQLNHARTRAHVGGAAHLSRMVVALVDCAESLAPGANAYIVKWFGSSYEMDEMRRLSAGVAMDERMEARAVAEYEVAMDYARKHWSHEPKEVSP